MRFIHLKLVISLLLFATSLTGQRTFLTISPDLYAGATETYVAYSDFDGNIINAVILEADALSGEAELDLYTYLPEEVVVTIINRMPDESGLPSYRGWVLPYPDSTYVGIPQAIGLDRTAVILNTAESKLGVAEVPMGKKYFLPPGTKQFFRKVTVLGGRENAEIVRFNNSVDHGYRVLLTTDDPNTYAEVYLEPTTTLNEVETHAARYPDLPWTEGIFQVSLPSSVEYASVFHENEEGQRYLLYSSDRQNPQHNFGVVRSYRAPAGRIRIDYGALNFQGYNRVDFTEYFPADADFVDVEPEKIPDLNYQRVGRKEVLECVDTTVTYAYEHTYFQSLIFPEDSPETIIRQTPRTGVIRSVNGVWYDNRIGQLEMRVIGSSRANGQLYQLPSLVDILFDMNAPITGLEDRELSTLKVRMETGDVHRPVVTIFRRY
ncbi:hypothetical protein [Lewinella sp. 4G2]|uniref:hypothetical protein n=1 Tax=Lewinella sp. 4G2 TaxID=1803372 RepID=UPI0007B46710|nr:hypothetical protein [Lewinella sp. 4G2]OAV43986.1 hypothetical protein A3850_005525 [Lewinella sp. 4G2]